MEIFAEKYLTKFRNNKISILDVGSQDVGGEGGGSYKNIFGNKNWKYVGADMKKGNNVDIVIKDVYRWKEIDSNSFDVVVSGQAFEHVEYFWLTMKEVKRVLKKDGLCCIIAPSSGPEHKYPLDCWRFYPDGFKALAKYAEMETLESYLDDSNSVWRDCVLICRKTKDKG